MVSAVKVGGRRLHELARPGMEVERAPRPVTVDRFEVWPGDRARGRTGSRWSAPRAPTCGCWPPTWGRRWAAGPTCGTCAAPGSGRSPSPRPAGWTSSTPAHLLTPAAGPARPRRRSTVDAEVADLGRPRPARSTGCRWAPRATARGPWSTTTGRLLAVYEGTETDRIRPAWCWPAEPVTRPRCSTGRGEPRRVPPGANLRSDGVLRPDQCETPDGGTAVTIGAYDGVHLGHRHLLSAAADAWPPSGACERGGRHLRPPPGDRGAARVGAPAPHRPRPEARAAGRLRASTSPWWCPSTRPGPTRRPRTSCPRSWSAPSGPRLVVVGEDFHFGHGRKGNVALLPSWGPSTGFDVEGVGLAGDRRARPSPPPASAGCWPRATSPARRALLGRPTRCGAWWSTATAGAGRARLPDGQRGRAGRDRPARATASTPAGTPGPTARTTRRPSRSGAGPPSTTPDGAPPLLEAYLLDFDGDLYGEAARVSFVERLRDEERFDAVEDLVAQMDRDVDAARARLDRPDAPSEASA